MPTYINISIPPPTPDDDFHALLAVGVDIPREHVLPPWPTERNNIPIGPIGHIGPHADNTLN